MYPSAHGSSQDQVTKEQETRLMWRVVMGNAPGLKAEIAKLHATEQARLALKEWERGRASQSISGARQVQTPATIQLTALSSSPTGSPTAEFKRGALNGPSDWKETKKPVRPQTDRPRSPDNERATAADDAGGGNVRKTGSGGVLGWMWSQFAAKGETPQDTRSGSRAPKGMEGPFTA